MVRAGPADKSETSPRVTARRPDHNERQKQMSTTNAKAIRQVKRAFDLLDQVFYSRSRNHASDLLKQCTAEEKDHRGCCSDFAQYHPGACSITEAAKMFAVKRVAEYLNTPRAEYPSGQAFLHFQRSCFWAAGIADEFAAEVRNAWTAQNIAELADLDYCHFVSPDKSPAPTQAENSAAAKAARA